MALSKFYKQSHVGIKSKFSWRLFDQLLWLFDQLLRLFDQLLWFRPESDLEVIVHYSFNRPVNVLKSICSYMYYFTFFSKILQSFSKQVNNSDRDLENLTGEDLTCADITYTHLRVSLS